MYTVLENYLDHLLFNFNLPRDLFSKEFQIEDGRNLSSFISKEITTSILLSQKFGFKDGFSFKVLAKKTLSTGKHLVYIDVYNSSGRLAFRTNLTLSNFYNYIDSNNYLSEVVSKYELDKGCVKGISLGITSAVKILGISSPSLKLERFGKSINYAKDNFYSAMFTYTDSCSGFQVFYIKYEGGFIEKRYVFVETFNCIFKPYTEDDNFIYIVEDNYPVEVTLISADNHVSIHYPLDLKIPKCEYDTIIVTDLLDNDWII